MKKAIITISIALISIISFGKDKKQTQTIKGHVVEIVDGIEHPIAMAFVYCENSSITSYTNEKGEFTLNLPKGKQDVKVSFMGYNSKIETINTSKTTEVNFKIAPTSFADNQK